MQLKVSPLKKFLSAAYRRQAIDAANYRQFTQGLSRFLQEVKAAEKSGQTEENMKYPLRDFLNDVLYHNQYAIKPKALRGNFEIDLAIHTGKKAQTAAGVLLEVKRPGNKSEMISRVNLNRKALQEAVLYYLWEKVVNENHELKHIVITNLYKWYIFDATEFNRCFYQDKNLTGHVQKWKDKQLDSERTRQMYEIIKKHINQSESTIEATEFDLLEYNDLANRDDEEAQDALTILYKILSPPHLLKQSVENDSNSLNEGFYKELLYILGLREYKDGSKKIISRNTDSPDGTLLENTISQLDTEGIIDKDSLKSYGENRKERLFNVAMELCITWMNRILFLKLLEAQLISYHLGDRSFAFMAPGKLKQFDELNTLFFKVLARKVDDRPERIKDKFPELPYLNSSLFDPTGLESESLRISNLQSTLTIPPYQNTVLLDDQGRKLSKSPGSGKLPVLDYLLRFLDAYDFGSDTHRPVKEKSKSLISASVLGLVFEKINGYREGSFYTPGFVTMYMARETLRKSVLDKCNETFGLTAESIPDLANDLTQFRISAKKVNPVIDNLKICDPAVGSGHFLVSALNELIAVKSELGVLTDHNGKLIEGYQVKVSNDELELEDDDHNFYNYTVTRDPETGIRTINKEIQRIQQGLFHQKQKLIENCLFGVDININSVKICRLRLWIELLKNAYYRSDEDEYSQLETLPNIDINIKQGNSLVSRFSLDADLRKALQKNKKWDIDSYRMAVHNYRNAEDKEEKRDMERLIQDIKSNFRTEITLSDPRSKRLQRLENQHYEKYVSDKLFREKPTVAEDKNRKNIEKQIEKLTAELEAVKNSKIFNNAFEWRFEFPEVLNDDGDFTGFDVVIGNPPYIRQEHLKPIKDYLKDHYETYTSTADILVYFVELGMRILRDQGRFTFIISNKFMRANFGQKFRKWLKQYQITRMIDFGDLPVFEEASTYPMILGIKKDKPRSKFFGANVETLDFDDLGEYLQTIGVESNQDLLRDEAWVISDEASQALVQKLMKQGVPLKEYVDGKIYRGVLTGYNEAFVVDEATKDRLIEEDPNSAEVLKPFLAGRDIKRYEQPKPDKWLIFFKAGWTKEQFGNLKESEAFSKILGKYPAIANHLKPFEEKAKARYDKGDYWWELRKCAYYEEFEKEKIICPAIVKSGSYALDTNGAYSNDKTTIIESTDLSLLAILNSKIADFIIYNTSSTKRGGYFEYKPMYIENIPIVKPNEEQKKKLESMTRDLIEAYNKGDESKVRKLEHEISYVVYMVYRIYENDIDIMENAV